MIAAVTQGCYNPMARFKMCITWLYGNILHVVNGYTRCSPGVFDTKTW